MENIANLAVDLDKKRPPKAQAVSFISNQYAALKAGIPGSTKENIRAQFALGNHYLYESEVKDIIKENAGKDGFDAKEFVELLKFCGCIKAGSTPKIGEGMVLVDSLERATEVAKVPADAKRIQEIMSKMTSLRDLVKPLIHGTCSIALKNPKVKAAKGEVATETASQ
jgi:hypothetical protein